MVLEKRVREREREIDRENGEKSGREKGEDIARVKAGMQLKNMHTVNLW